MDAVVLCPLMLGAFGGVYWKVAPTFDTERKRAYVLSAISSCVMTTISVPFLVTYLGYGLAGVCESGQRGWMWALGRFGVLFFGTYLFADLSVGYFMYRAHVGLLTGWIHHTVYIGLMVYCYMTRQTPVFLTAAIMELPTFDLAISNLFPGLRNDVRFLGSFFLIRLVFHVVILYDSLRPASRAVMEGSWVPVVVLIPAFIMHASWFHGGVKGYLKRQSKRGERRNEKAQDDLPELAECSSEPDTPEDSPLVTPHTPKTYAGNHLTSMPQIPQINLMSTVSIPSFSDLTAALNSRDQLNFGFKNAVKHRWEEQKGKFAGMRSGGLQFDPLGLRQRGSGDGAGVVGR